MRKIPFVTASIINCYLDCKYSFWETYIQGDGFKSYRVDDEDGEPIYLQFGTLVHGVIEQFWKNPLNRTRKFLISTYETDLISCGLSDKSYVDLGYEMLDNFFNYLLTDAPRRKAIHSELAFNVVIGGIPLHGTIDQIFYHGDGIYEIEDYKTSKWMKTQDEVDEDIQLSMYDLVYSNDVMKDYWYNGIKPKAIILSLHYLRHKVVLKTERTSYSRVNALSYFRILYKQMQILDDKKFVPTLNRFCTYCDCHSCKAYESVVNNDYVPQKDSEFSTSQEYHLAMYQDYNNRMKILEAEANAHYEQLFDYLEKPNAEPISHNGYDYFLAQSGRRYVKTDLAIKILEESGLWNFKDFVSSLPVGKIEELLKKHPDVMARMNTFAIGFNYTTPKLSSKKTPKLFKRSKR